MWTWAQLGLHRKPVGLLNAGGYFDALLDFLNRSVESGFVRVKHRSILQVAQDAETLLDCFAHYEPPDVPTWVGKADT
jgi:predicted Rossmann-fold nucleotide-binding protein